MPEGEDLELPCVYTGTPPLISKWTKKGAPLIGPPGALTLREVSRKDAGVYICTVYNPAGRTRERSYVSIRKCTRLQPKLQPGMLVWLHT